MGHKRESGSLLPGLLPGKKDYLICPKKNSIITLDTRPKKKQHILILIPTHASMYAMGANRPITSTMASGVHPAIKRPIQSHNWRAAFPSMGISYINVMRKFGLFEQCYYGIINT
jgi:hypothetical protein